ncbi:hypothetical protein D3C87_1731820 [compost metagenome]
MPVIGVVDGDDVAVAGIGTRQPERQIVGLAAGIDEEADVERVGELGCQPP